MYGGETWAMKVNDMLRLERAENTMLKWMCGVTLKDIKRPSELMDDCCERERGDETWPTTRWHRNEERKKGVAAYRHAGNYRGH